MNIGGVKICDGAAVTLAPLAGYGDVAFRRLCRDFGASLTTTEMVSVKGLCYGNEKTETLLRLAPNESPSCVQLFGGDPEYFYRALKLPALDKFDIIDINMGCPVPKVTKCGEGGALMKDVSRAAQIVAACVSAAGGRPVTVKHRIGFYDGEFIAPEFAAAMEKAGAAAVTVHGRTVAQGYGGRADRDAVEKTAHAVNIPVFGNGDVVCREDADDYLSRGCAGVAVGRGALGRPDIFAFSDSKTSRLDIMLRHIDYALLYFDESTAVRTMRKHIVRYLAKVAGAKELKLRVNRIESADELKAELRRAAEEGVCLR